LFQESGAIPTGPIVIDGELWVGYRIYLLFQFITCCWTLAKVLRIWFRVPPFTARAQTSSDPHYFVTLQHSAVSISRWTGLVLLACCFVAALAIARMASNLPQFSVAVSEVLATVRDLSASLAAALCVTVFLYLTRWHLLLRIERSQR